LGFLPLSNTEPGSIIDIKTDIGRMIFESKRTIDLKLVARLHDELVVVNNVSPLKTFLSEESTLSPGAFSLQVITLDGRTFSNGLFFDDGFDKDPFLTFYAPDKWKSEELLGQRFTRNTTIELIKTAGLTKVRVEFEI